MLLKLFVLLSFTSLVLSQYEIDPTLSSQIIPVFQEQNPAPSELNNAENEVATLSKTTDTICPANEVLIQIKNILTDLLEGDDNDILKMKDIQQGLLSNKTPLNVYNGIDKLGLPISKRKTLRQLLESNNFNGNYKTKITVQYEVPNEVDVNCKQALTNILQVLKKANLVHDSSRSCGPYDINCPKENVLDMKNIGNQNVFTTNINQGNSNYPPNISPSLLNYQNSINSNNVLGSGQDINSILKYLAWNKRNPDLESMFQNYKSKDQGILNDLKISNTIPESIEKVTSLYNTDNTELVPNNHTNYFDNSTPYQLHITENILKPTNQNFNRSDKLAENSIQGDTQVPLDKLKNQDLGVEKPDDVFVTVTNDGKIVSVYPSKNNLYENDKDTAANHVKNLLNQYFKGNVNNLPRDKMNAMLAVLKTRGTKHLNTVPYYVNPNLLSLSVKPYSMINAVPTSSIRQIPYKESLNDQLHANLNVFNQISNQENLLTNSAYQTYVNENPYVVNSKLADYGKHGNQLHAPHNLNNLQWPFGETNQIKLNSDNSGVVELTYLLKRPNPVVYQPVYYVKYRLPYDSFVNNLRDLVRKQPQLRSNRAKLYQELLALSRVAEVSPNLKGLGQQQLLQMVANNGALVKTKVLKVNETLLDEQMKTVGDLNTNLAPREIRNITNTGDSKYGILKSETQGVVLNNTKINEFEKEKLIASNFKRDIFDSYNKATNNYNGISRDNNTTN